MSRIRNINIKNGSNIFGGDVKFHFSVRTIARFVNGKISVRIIPRKREHDDEYKYLLRTESHCDRGTLIKCRSNRK